MLFVTLVVVVLAFGSQAVLSFDSITFSPIEQCGPFNVSFAGGQPPAALPLSLTVVPFNSTPLSIPIPNSAWNAATSTGAAITFLPFAAGTSFIASLDDATGHSTGRVSDVMEIQSSSNSSCVSSTASNSTNTQYTLVNSISQCQSFNVSYNTAVVSRAPSVRAFIPRSRAFFLNQTAPAFQGTATYVMNVTTGRAVVLLVDDGNGHQQTSPLETVQGNSSSSTTCIPSELDMRPTATSQTGKPLSRGAIIAIAVGSSGAVLGVSILMAFYAHRERRRRRSRLSRGVEDKGDLPPLPPPTPPRPARPPASLSSRIIQDPAPYGPEISMSPASPSFMPKTRASGGIEYSSSSSSGNVGLSSYTLHAITRASPGISNSAQQVQQQQSVNSLDIERILEMATVYSNPSNGASSEALSVIGGGGGGASTGNARPNGSRGHQRDPSDVPLPAGPIVSFALSSNRGASFSETPIASRPSTAPQLGHGRGPSDVTAPGPVRTEISLTPNWPGRPPPAHAPRPSVDSVPASFNSDTSSSAHSRPSNNAHLTPLFTPYLGGVSEVPDGPTEQPSGGPGQQQRVGLDYGEPPPPPPINSGPEQGWAEGENRTFDSSRRR